MRSTRLNRKNLPCPWGAHLGLGEPGKGLEKKTLTDVVGKSPGNTGGGPGAALSCRQEGGPSREEEAGREQHSVQQQP